MIDGWFRVICRYKYVTQPCQFSQHLNLIVHFPLNEDVSLCTAVFTPATAILTWYTIRDNFIFSNNVAVTLLSKIMKFASFWLLAFENWKNIRSKVSIVLFTGRSEWTNDVYRSCARADRRSVDRFRKSQVRVSRIILAKKWYLYTLT